MGELTPENKKAIKYANQAVINAIKDASDKGILCVFAAAFDPNLGGFLIKEDEVEPDFVIQLCEMIIAELKGEEGDASLN